MNILKALDAAFTTLVNELFPFPVFPSLDDVPDEIRQAGPEFHESYDASSAPVSAGVVGDTPVGGEPSPAPADGPPALSFDELHDAAVLLWRYSATDVYRHDADEAFTLSKKLHAIADAMK